MWTSVVISATLTYLTYFALSVVISDLEFSWPLRHRQTETNIQTERLKKRQTDRVTRKLGSREKDKCDDISNSDNAVNTENNFIINDIENNDIEFSRVRGKITLNFKECRHVSSQIEMLKRKI